MLADFEASEAKACLAHQEWQSDVFRVSLSPGQSVTLSAPLPPGSSP